MIGKKGPFVHIAAIIANLISKFPPFHVIRKVILFCCTTFIFPFLRSQHHATVSNNILPVCNLRIVTCFNRCLLWDVAWEYQVTLEHQSEVCLLFMGAALSLNAHQVFLAHTTCMFRCVVQYWGHIHILSCAQLLLFLPVCSYLHNNVPYRFLWNYHQLSCCDRSINVFWNLWYFTFHSFHSFVSPGIIL